MIPLYTNKRTYPAQIDRTVDISTVFLIYDNLDYAVYVGCGAENWVIRHGDKLSFEEARLHFLGIEKEHYRL